MWRLKAVRHKVHPQCDNLEEFQFKRREYEKGEHKPIYVMPRFSPALRKARKDQLLVSKRLLQEESDHEGMEITAEVLSKKELFRGIQQSDEERVNALRDFRRALRHKETQHIFVKLENSMHLLVGLFSGSNAVWQLAAAHCLHEFSHSEEPSIALACLPATPYLLTYLSGQSAKFTELCLYTLGNLTAESEAVRKQLLAQGIVPALASCIQSPHAAVVEAVSYTLSQLLQAKEAPEKIIPKGSFTVISPVLRCLGNLLTNHGMESCREQMRDSRVLVALCAFIQGFYSSVHLARESLWVINNLTADDPVFCSAVFYLNLVPVFMQLLPFSKGINIMVLRLLCNIAEKGPVYCQQLQQREIFSALHATLRMAEPEVVRLSLELLHIIVASIPQVTDEFTEKGISALEAIQYNSDEEIRLRASYILDRYLHKHSQVNTPAV